MDSLFNSATVGFHHGNLPLCPAANEIKSGVQQLATKDMSTWNTAISEVISTDSEEEIMVRGLPLSQLIGKTSFAEMMFLMLRGNMPTPAQARVLDALLVASMEHGIAPPSMISRCFASYGTSIQAAVGGGVLAFGLAEVLLALFGGRIAIGNALLNVFEYGRLDLGLTAGGEREQADAHHQSPCF